ncbi:MAG: hypothetical protein HKK67_11390 [Chlorobiaceae bacterium]|nr:hypothetical protein [Chlorobiaceae bacterium]
MNTVAEVAEIAKAPPAELERMIVELKEKLADNQRELARVDAVSKKSSTPTMRDMLVDIYALDIDTETKREMTNTCLRLINIDIMEKRMNIELTENDAAFLSILQKKHPNLNMRELKICLFIKLNYDTCTIANTTGITTRGMESIRYRTHKKLGLGKHDAIKSYLNELALS